MTKDLFIAPAKDTDCSYENLLGDLFVEGATKGDRTGTGTLSDFGTRLVYDLQLGFPLLTTKKVWFKGVVEELLWFLSGSTNNHDLVARGVHIWDEWCGTDGELGPIYGQQWRSWAGQEGPIDQISWVINEIRTNPNSRRLVVSAWNVTDLPRMALAPCHCLFQFDVTGGELNCQLYQRSADIFLGVPFNIASYALLTCLVAQQCDLKPGHFTWVGGDTHLYLNHIEQAKTQLQRPGRPFPGLELRRAKDIFSYTADDISVVGYDPHPSIAAPVAV